MATKSFLRNIVIKNKKDANKFVDALEKAENKKSKKVVLDHPVVEITDKDQIREIFNNN